MRALVVFLIVVAFGSLAMFALYASIDISHSLGALGLLGALAAVTGWLTGRAGVIAAPLAFYIGVLFWPSIIDMFCAPEGCTPPPLEAYVTLIAYYWPLLLYVTLAGAVGSLIRARSWRRVLDRSAT